MNTKAVIRTAVLCLSGMLIIAASYLQPIAPQNDENAPTFLDLSLHGNVHAYAVVFSPQGDLFVVGSSIGIHVFNAQTNQEVRFIPTPTWVRALAFSPDGRLLAVGGYDSVVRIWQTDSWDLLKEITGHQGWVRALAFSPDGSYLVSASDDNTIRGWGIPIGEQIFILEQGMEGVRTVALSPDGHLLATGGYDRVVRLWDTRTQTLMRDLHGHRDWIRCLAFSPHGNFLASGGFDATVRLWNLDNGELLVTREEHTSSVLGLAFSPNGELLASASADQTVRLWRMPDLQPYALFEGHENFVFSVFFSPDGTKIATGSADNRVALWNVPSKLSQNTLELIPSPSNCTACHHPRGTIGPPRVIDTSCETCHEDNALVLNWCPLFPRFPNLTKIFIYPPQKEKYKIGIPVPNPSFAVIIYSPGNGEVIYGKEGTQVPFFVTGKVLADNNALKRIFVRLEIWSGESLFQTTLTKPEMDGFFIFNLKHNPKGFIPFSGSHGILSDNSKCLFCHNIQFDAELPEGKIRLKVIAYNPDNQEASDERWIHVDASRTANIPVLVLDENGQPVEGAPIQASTLLYAWRARTFFGMSGEDGRTLLQVEALSQSPTKYTLKIQDGVMGDTWYKGLEEVEITLPAAATQVEEITLYVLKRLGQINGSLHGLKKPLSIWAIRLPDGYFQITQTASSGAFSLMDLPIGEYILTADPQASYEQGLLLNLPHIDFTQSPSVTLELAATPIQWELKRGKLTDVDGGWLPFGWISNERQTVRIKPLSGEFTLVGEKLNGANFTVTAPGFYSQVLDMEKDQQTIALIRLPETILIPWGKGSIVLPPETLAQTEGAEITLQKGWIWGEGREGQAVNLHVGNTTISIHQGKFALEHLPSRSSWFYLFDGQATIERTSEEESITVHSGEMVYLEKRKPLPVPYDSIVINALHENEENPLSITWQPSLESKIQNTLHRFGVSIAQVMTIIAYLLASLALFIIPIYAIKWLLSVRKEETHD